jgi:hypothetical protein
MLQRELGEEIDGVEPFLLAFADHVHQAPLPGFPGVEPFAVEDDLQGSFQANNARQALRAAPARQETQFNFRQTKLRRWLIEGRAVVARQRELQAASQARTVDGGHRRHR